MIFETELIGRAGLDDASTHVIHVGAELAGRKRTRVAATPAYWEKRLAPPHYGRTSNGSRCRVFRLRSDPSSARCSKQLSAVLPGVWHLGTQQEQGTAQKRER